MNVHSRGGEAARKQAARSCRAVLCQPDKRAVSFAMRTCHAESLPMLKPLCEDLSSVPLLLCGYDKGPHTTRRQKRKEKENKQRAKRKVEEGLVWDGKHCLVVTDRSMEIREGMLQLRSGQVIKQQTGSMRHENVERRRESGCLRHPQECNPTSICMAP